MGDVQRWEWKLDYASNDNVRTLYVHSSTVYDRSVEIQTYERRQQESRSLADGALLVGEASSVRALVLVYVPNATLSRPLAVFGAVAPGGGGG